MRCHIYADICLYYYHERCDDSSCTCDDFVNHGVLAAPNKIFCDKNGCGEEATRILHWKGYNRPPHFFCDKDAESALMVVHF